LNTNGACKLQSLESNLWQCQLALIHYTYNCACVQSRKHFQNIMAFEHAAAPDCTMHTVMCVNKDALPYLFHGLLASSSCPIQHFDSHYLAQPCALIDLHAGTRMLTMHRQPGAHCAPRDRLALWVHSISEPEAWSQKAMLRSVCQTEGMVSSMVLLVLTCWLTYDAPRNRN